MSLHLLPNGVTPTPGVTPLLAKTAAWYLLLLSGPTVQVILSSVPHHAAVGHFNPSTVAHIVLALEPYSVTVIIDIIALESSLLCVAQSPKGQDSTICPRE